MCQATNLLCSLREARDAPIKVAICDTTNLLTSLRDTFLYFDEFCFFIVGKGLAPFLMFVGCFRFEERDKPFPYGFYFV